MPPLFAPACCIKPLFASPFVASTMHDQKDTALPYPFAKFVQPYATAQLDPCKQIQRPSSK
jgi:hypothetical protein